MASHHTPMRTCVATKATKPHTELLRVVVDREASARLSAQGQSAVTVVVPDPLRRRPGRGAWVTQTVAAYEQAIARRAFQRALRLSTPVDARAVLRYLESRAAAHKHDDVEGKGRPTTMSSR